MSHIVEIALVIGSVLFLLQLARPAPIEPRDVQVWNDDVERRLLYGRSPRDYR
jgi:hypothetical protein